MKLFGGLKYLFLLGISMEYFLWYGLLVGNLVYVRDPSYLGVFSI